MAIAHKIAERLKERFHPEVVAIGLYGSLAREEDGPTVLPLYDPEHFFAEIRTIAQASPESLFQEAIANLLVDDVFECIGKIRNAQALGNPTVFPTLVMKLGHVVAMMVGLANRQCYTTGTRVIPEAVALPDLPDGFRELGQIILTGDLRDGPRLGIACEHLWQGINIWTEGHGYQIISPQQIPF